MTKTEILAEAKKAEVRQLAARQNSPGTMALEPATGSRFSTPSDGS
jgi:hypothetical protein